MGDDIMAGNTFFHVNQADLEFILRQIRVSEAHSNGTDLVEAIMAEYGVSAGDANILPVGLRTVSGTLNNLANPNWGAADQPIPRLSTPDFRDIGVGSIDFDGPAPGSMDPLVQGDYGVAGNVVDSSPRTISNLVVNQTVDNPAAVDAWFNNPLSLAKFQEVHGADAIPLRPGEAMATNGVYVTNDDITYIPNLSPDIGLSPSYNSWMTFFGQFFDHGLDLIPKAENGTVYIPLNIDDPLVLGDDGMYSGVVNGVAQGDDLPTHLRFMAVTRAKVDADNNAENTTTPFVDQNQTYTSHPSHQVFLREYMLDADGKPVATGKLLDGQQSGTVPTWADIKTQARDMLGIELNDFNVHNVPLLMTDEYGEFIRGANGYPLMVLEADNSVVEGNPLAPIDAMLAVPSGHAFLHDIAHHAAPQTGQVADADTDIIDDGNSATYDNEMLDAHHITGDGRGNENIALTAVHSVFHSEHNRLIEANRATILESQDLAFLNEWLVNPVTDWPADQAAIDALVWDGERIFHAAKFVTEMQYQHLVFEEFARLIQPNVDPFVFTNTPDMDASIIAEFAHVVYRFGHSMLNQTVDRLDNDLSMINGDTDQLTLIDAFLNPQAFAATGTDVEEIIANIARGAVRDIGNEMDEFVVPALQTNLLGLPLDLAAINIARGRETGMKSLNEIRKEFYNDYGLTDLKPYTSWLDFAQHIKHPTSIINFIAAYGTHSLIQGAEYLEEKRAIATAIVTGQDASWEFVSSTGTIGGTITALGITDRLDFLNATGAYATTELGGMNNVDFWLGGLAEELNEFGGMLGSTFNFIFEYQMEHLQTGDRFYYLSRTQGTNLLDNLEPNTFTDLVMRNSDLSDPYATHMNASIFVTPDYIFELDRQIAEGHDVDPVHEDAFLQMIDPKVVRIQTDVFDANGHDFGGTLKFSGGEHVVLGGTEGNDSLYGDKGIDALYGDGGDDYLNAGMEADHYFGGDGNDIIEDPFGDDFIRGENGDDVIAAGTGLDLIFGGRGKDYIIMGMDDKEAFGGDHDDFVLGGTGNEFVAGGEGDDWIEGGDGFDVLAGEHSELFFNSPIIGHDILWGQGNDTDYDAESGDDIMVSGPGIQRFEGMFGFDWAIAKYDVAGANFDFQVPIFTSVQGNILRDRFDLVEAASGWDANDTLYGDDRGRADAAAEAAFDDHILDNAGIDRIDGLRELLGLNGVADASFRDGNILLGGDGSDEIMGRGGFDVIDGDSWLNVRIQIDMGEGVFYTAESLTTDTSAAGEFAGRVRDMDGNVMFEGRSLNELMLTRVITPGQLSAVREILSAENSLDDVDTAVFRGNRDEYNIEGLDTMTIGGLVRSATGVAEDLNGDGFISVEDTGDGNGRVFLNETGVLTDETDLVKNIEVLRFADQSVNIIGVSDIRWNGVEPAQWDLPGAGIALAQLTTNGQVTQTFSLAGASAAGIEVDANGLVTASAGLAPDTTYEVIVNVTTAGGTYQETFNVVTGDRGGQDFTVQATSGDDVFYGHRGADTLMQGGAG
ncbi:MAG: peroxidase family protein, partial [Flavimaricola sp.]|nr:peroxidase family protein [Flavimaricola sp.]